jgi:hypothetical protein
MLLHLTLYLETKSFTGASSVLRFMDTEVGVPRRSTCDTVQSTDVLRSIDDVCIAFNQIKSSLENCRRHVCSFLVLVHIG